MVTNLRLASNNVPEGPWKSEWYAVEADVVTRALESDVHQLGPGSDVSVTWYFGKEDARLQYEVNVRTFRGAGNSREAKHACTEKSMVDVAKVLRELADTKAASEDNVEQVD
jgi:hypothetical protein